MLAVQDGQVNAMRRILNDNNESINAQNSDGNSAYMIVTEKCHMKNRPPSLDNEICKEIIKFLIENEADVDLLNNEGKSFVKWTEPEIERRRRTRSFWTYIVPFAYLLYS